MQVVTRKAEVKEYLDKCLSVYDGANVPELVEAVHCHILNRKVKFPLLEYCGKIIHGTLAHPDRITFCDQLEALKTEGGNVILGIILQNELSDHFELSIQKTVEYISRADVWYVCDIIGERVFGFSLLNQPARTIPEIQRLTTSASRWVVRSLGAGVHYAIKKGLDKAEVRTVFRILLSNAGSTDKEIRQGVGWAAKTTAAFHPDVIDFFKDEINDKISVANWFRAKIEIGLSRNRYAKRNSG